MIISCPACKTRYVVPDSAIGVDGRTVRCAKCRHSWFQDGPELVLNPAAVPPIAPLPAPAAPPSEPVIEAEIPPPISEPPPPPPAAVYDDTASEYDHTRSSFDHEPPFRPRRNPAKMFTMAAIVIAAVALGAIGAVYWYGLPNWAPFANQTFADGQADLRLDFPPNRLDRRTLPNGTEFFGANGKVANVGKERRTVPPILIVLRDAQDRIVYSLEVISPKRQLNPGESVTINEMVLDVPRSARQMEVGWKPG